MRPDDQKNNQSYIIKRKDSHGAASVEIAEIMILALGIQQNASDEKTGKDKEKIDSAPAEARQDEHGFVERGIESDAGFAKWMNGGVAEKNQQQRDSADAI